MKLIKLPDVVIGISGWMYSWIVYDTLSSTFVLEVQALQILYCYYHYIIIQKCKTSMTASICHASILPNTGHQNSITEQLNQKQISSHLIFHCLAVV